MVTRVGLSAFDMQHQGSRGGNVNDQGPNPLQLDDGLGQVELRRRANALLMDGRSNLGQP
eukprot:scaffold781_cov172-Pinguiococcus_pyrenoidosus.AAC.1